MVANQSNLPTIQRLKYEDYVRSNDWKQSLQGLINALNLFMTPVYNILDGQVGYMNLQVPQIVTQTIAGGSPTSFTFVNPLTIIPTSVILGNCWTGIPSTHPAVALQLYWHMVGNTVVVDDVIGLTVGTTYNLTLVVQ